MIRIDDEREEYKVFVVNSFLPGIRKRCTKGHHAPSCISFHLNAARMRCAPIQFARVLGCRLCCGFECAPLIRAACREVVEK